MSKRRVREGLRCARSGKVIFTKKGALTSINAQGKRGKRGLDLYPCGNHWHITHKEGLKYREQQRINGEI